MTAAASLTNAGTMELVEHVAGDARDLIRLEVELAKNELSQELAAVKSSTILGVFAMVLGIMGLASLVLAIGLALGPIGALAAAVLLLAAAGIAGLIAYRRLPKKVLAATGLRLKDDEAILRGHLS